MKILVLNVLQILTVSALLFKVLDRKRFNNRLRRLMTKVLCVAVLIRVRQVKHGCALKLRDWFLLTWLRCYCEGRLTYQRVVLSPAYIQVFFLRHFWRFHNANRIWFSEWTWRLSCSRINSFKNTCHAVLWWIDFSDLGPSTSSISSAHFFSKTNVELISHAHRWLAILLIIVNAFHFLSAVGIWRLSVHYKHCAWSVSALAFYLLLLWNLFDFTVWNFCILISVFCCEILMTALSAYQPRHLVGFTFPS